MPEIIPVMTVRAVEVRDRQQGRLLLSVPGLDIGGGSFVGVTGRSGAGKSLFLKTLGGITAMDEALDVRGSIWLHENQQKDELLGMKARKRLSRLSGHLCVITQEPPVAFSPIRSCGDHLRDAYAVRRSDMAHPVDWQSLISGLVDEVGLKPGHLDRYPFELSGGELQRMSLLAGLVSGCRLILADEPCSSLDAIQSRRFMDLLTSVAGSHGLTAVVVSHDRSLLEAYCDRMLTVRDGVVLPWNSPSASMEDAYLQPTYPLTPGPGERHSPVEEPFIEAKDIRFSYHGGETGQVLGGVSIRVAQGARIGITGPSGAGKSTLARQITGLSPLQSGQLLFHGRPFGQMDSRQISAFYRAVRYLHQDPLQALNSAHTLARQLRLQKMAWRNRGIVVREEDISALLESLGLWTGLMDLYPYQLSGGQRQRLQLLMSLLGDPELLVADEPFSALDPDTKLSLMDLFNTVLAGRQMSVLLVSHRFDELLHCCDELWVMHEGVIVEQGQVQKIVKNPLHAVTKALLDASI